MRDRYYCYYCYYCDCYYHHCHLFANKDNAMEVEDAACIPTYLTIQLMIQKLFMKYLKKGDRIN